MALFTDGPISDSADLQRCENDILSVASVESIDLGGKIKLAQEYLANEVLLFLLRRAPAREWPECRRVREVEDVVVSRTMRQWHIYKTLALVYQDAYNNQLNDRYQGKWQEYEQLAKSSEQTCFQLGVGLVADPVAKAPMPTLSSVTGPGSGALLYVAVTWLNASSQEGAPSEFAQLQTVDGQELVVTIGGAPQNVTSWNVYVGSSPNSAALQNASPIAIGTSSWTMTSGPNPGGAPGDGQRPNWFIVDHRVIERG
jgi:hypothetical protein